MEAEVPEAELECLLAAARRFLRGELGHVHPELPSLVSVLRATGAGECYHKHGTFLQHLLGVHHVLRLWGAPDAVVRCGLFHSSYSNSYVNLAIFNPDTTDRDRVRDVIGAPAERLVHLFCVVPRQALMHDDLHDPYTADELRHHLAASQASVIEAAAAGRRSRVDDDVELWRRKLRLLVPPGGIVTKQIRTGEPLSLPRRVVAAFALMTISDLSEQYTDYLTKLFGIENGLLEPQENNWGVLWPGTGEPGLWMSAVSMLAAVYNLIAKDEELDRLAASTAGEKENSKEDDDGDDMSLELVIPPVFARCTKMLDYEEEKAARDLYCEALRRGAACCTDMDGWQRLETMLRESMAKNPFVGEM